MKLVKMAGTDLVLSNVCYGTGNYGDGLEKEEAFEALDAFVDMGGIFVDTANVYCKWVPGRGNSAEQYLGEWLKSRNAYHKVVIATKGAHYDFSEPERSRVNEKEIRKDLEESLRTLGLDHIDFYWLHRDDREKPIEEILDIMEQLVQEGKIRYYGASNYRLDRLRRAREYAKGKGLQGFSAVSNQWSMAQVNPGGNLNLDPTLVITDEELVQWHQETGTPLVPFSSTAHGFFQKLYQAGVKVQDGKLLTHPGKLGISEELKRAYWNQDNRKHYEFLCRQMEKYQAPSLHVLSLAWLLHQLFQVFPVMSVSRREQMEALAQASEQKMDKEPQF